MGMEACSPQQARKALNRRSHTYERLQGGAITRQAEQSKTRRLWQAWPAAVAEEGEGEEAEDVTFGPICVCTYMVLCLYETATRSSEATKRSGEISGHIFRPFFYFGIHTPFSLQFVPLFFIFTQLHQISRLLFTIHSDLRIHYFRMSIYNSSFFSACPFIVVFPMSLSSIPSKL
jgi:hypothetical protein